MRTAVVTGAGSGIGRATAIALAKKGYDIVAVDRDGESAGQVAMLTGGSAEKVDVTDAAAMRDLAASMDAPAVLVNNAGVGMTGHFLDATDEDWEWILGINVRGVINGCRAFGPGMLVAGRGHVVNLSSGLGFTPRATESAYCASKAAVLSLSQSLRADWGPQGVGVSAICPGVIRTPILEGTRFLGDRATSRESLRAAFAKGHPPDAVAKAIVGAIEKNRAVVPVGIESWIGWGIHRLAPTRVVDYVARADLGGRV